MDQQTFDFFDELESRDTFFLPSDDTIMEVIAKIDNERYYLWRDGEPLMELIPTPLTILDD